MLFLLVALGLWDKFGKMLFRMDLNLYVMDTRSQARFAADLLNVFPDTDQRRAGIRVVIKPIDRKLISAGQVQWQETLAGALISENPGPLYFELGRPSSTSKKMLRLEIEKRFPDPERRIVLRRVIAFGALRTDSAAQACNQLEDDWTYSEDNFGGIALIVDDSTLNRVGSCLSRLLTARKPSAA